MKSKINWVIVLAVLLIFIASTTYGWQTSVKANVSGDEKIEKSLKENMDVFCNKIGKRNINDYDNLEKSKQYIINQFKSMGYTIGIQDFQIGDKNFSNIIATKDPFGKVRNTGTVIVGAHYDSMTGCADGGASAISALLSLADSYKHDNNIHYNIRFVAFVNGEKPFAKTDMMGSKIYSDYLKNQNENIKGAIILDSLGYYSDKSLSQRYPFVGFGMPNKGDFLALVGNSESKDFAGSIENYFNKKSSVPVKNINKSLIIGSGLSDSYPFEKNGFKSVLITDTSIYRFEDINRNEDTIKNINFNYMSEIVKNLKEYLINY